MKTKLPYIAVVAILVSACTTGTYMTKTYDDDIYFSPADVPPVTMVQDNAEKPAGTNKSDAANQRIVMSQMEKNADGSSTLNNYVYQPDEETQNSDNQAYDMDQQELLGSDTTVYYNDDDVKYVINNYYDGSDTDLDFAYRINRFHRPYNYSPFFYDDWYYGYSPFYSSGWGWDPWYYGGWGYPYTSYGYYSPFSFGYGGYWGGGYGGYYNSYYGGYYNGYNNGYYSGYYGTGGGFSSNHQIARRRATDMNVPGERNQNNNAMSGTRGSNLKGAIDGNSSEQKLPTGINNTWVENGHTRSRVINTESGVQDTKSATIVNNRRTITTIDGRRVTTTGGTQVQNENGTRTQVARPATDAQGNVRRTYQPSTTGRTYDQNRTVQGQNYTPSYNKPRIVNQSNYNNNSYTRPSTTVRNSTSPAVRSATTGSEGYSAPRSSSTVRQTYRSSSTYSSGSSSSPSRSSSTYSSPSSGSSSPSYSTPSRSYSAPASSGSSSGGSSSGGSSSGGSSSGGSSSGGSSSGSSSGGSSGGGSGHRR